MNKNLLFIILTITLTLFLVSCQQVKDSDIVIDQGGEISNIDKLKNFIQNIENDEKDKIRIVRHTTEGDPIYHTLTYTGENVKYIYDNSQDEYAGSNKGEKSTTCDKLKSKSLEGGTKYFLSGCSSNFGNYFSFRLPS